MYWLFGESVEEKEKKERTAKEIVMNNSIINQFDTYNTTESKIKNKPLDLKKQEQAILESVKNFTQNEELKRKIELQLPYYTQNGGKRKTRRMLKKRIKRTRLH